MAKRRRRELIEADQFHATVVSLLQIPHADWNDWELEWLLDQAQRPRDYIYSPNQRKVLNALMIFSRPHAAYAGYTVKELRRIAYRMRFDLDLEDQLFLETLERWQATKLKLRQIWRLVDMCRVFERISPDPLDETEPYPRDEAA